MRRIGVTGASHTLLNPIFVEAEPADADQLRSIAGVTQVARLARFHLDLDRAAQLLNVPAAWNLLGGTSNAGAGIRISNKVIVARSYVPIVAGGAAASSRSDDPSPS